MFAENFIFQIMLLLLDTIKDVRNIKFHFADNMSTENVIARYVSHQKTASLVVYFLVGVVMFQFMCTQIT